MKTGQAGIELIKQFEGLKLKAYLDIVGVPTIGYGSTGPDIKIGMVWTTEQCEERLKKDLEKFEKAILTSVKVPLTQNQFDALVCFTYNVGSGAFTGSTLLKLLNKSESITKVADQFLRWNKAGGKEVAGLTRRRAAERELFLKPEVQLNKDVPSESDMNDIFNQIEKDIFK
jgi:lysozyme